MRKTRQPVVSTPSQAPKAAKRPRTTKPATAASPKSSPTAKRPEPVDIRAAHQAWLELTGARNDHW